MWKNKQKIAVAVMAIWIGFVNADSSISSSGGGGADNAGLTASKFEGRLEFHKSLAVGLTTGTADYPELVRIEWIRFDTRYANAWGATVRVGWLPVKDATWRLTIELLDKEDRVLQHSRDDPTVFTCKTGESGQTDVRYAELDLGAMHDQGRRHARRFRVHLKPLERQAGDTDSADIETHTLEVALVDQESREPITDASVVVSSSYLRDTFLRDKALYITDSQGRCRITLAQDGLVTLGISAQKEDYCTMLKSWSNSGSWALGRAPIVNLSQRHVLEMVRASALGGIVQDTEGNPIVGAEARLEARLEELSGTMNVNRTVLTDANGCWRVEGIPGEAERITLRLKHPEYSGNKERYRRIEGEALLNARAFKHVQTLEKDLTIIGRVLDYRDQPVADATAMLMVRSYRPVCAITDVSGAFRLVCSSDQSDYREIPSIIVEAPGYAPIQQNIDLQPAPEALEFRLKRGRNITCRVLGTEGQPVVGAWTVVQPLEGNRNYSVWLKDTDDRGQFQILNVPQNDVKLTVGKEGYIAIRDHILAASEDEVVVTMRRALRVHGTVTDAETGKTIPNFEVAAVFDTGGRTRTSRTVAFAEGTYEISFDEAQPETRQLKISAVGYEPATSDNIKIDEGKRVINFKLAKSTSFNQATAGRPREQIRPTGPRVITGVIRDERGELVSNAIVSTRPKTIEDTITDAEGRFKLRQRSSSMSRPREDIVYLLVRHKERNLAAAVELDESADTIDITLVPAVIMSGRIVNVEGKGVPGAELSLTFWVSDSGYGSREVAHIDAQGNYEIRAVPSGHRYSVTASAEGYGQQYVSVHTAEAADDRMELEPLTLEIANLSVSGIVVDVDGKPVANAEVNASGRGQPDRWDIATDEKGLFRIQGVCAGRLRLWANVRRKERLYGSVESEGGAADVKIIVSQRGEMGRYVPKQPPSLVSKALPGLKALGINRLPADLTGKRILVCFWDMNQRPSRHCIVQLAKQAGQIQEKGTIVVAVQASEADENKLNEWVKKYNIIFPVGMVQDDVEKSRFAWGVKSLPWLILTDRNHVVTAEGFNLNELNDKIKGAD
jgi:hypothetical protein